MDMLDQAMVNAVKKPEKTMKMFDTHDDIWQEEHNRVVTEYQREHKVRTAPVVLPRRSKRDSEQHGLQRRPSPLERKSI